MDGARPVVEDRLDSAEHRDRNQDRDARVGRNPRTGASVSVAEKAVPYFKTGKQLRDQLNGGADTGGADD